MAQVVTPCAATLVAPITMVARPATAPNVQREIFIRWVFPRGVDAVRRHLSVSHATSDVESAGSPEILWRDEALVVLFGTEPVTATPSDLAQAKRKVG
jgi:hypothetical protein